MAKAVITNKGFALLAKLPQGNTLKITSAKSGSGAVDATLLEEQTSLTTQKQTFTIENVSFPEERKCSLILSLTNEGLTSGYPLSQIGIYAQDPDEGEVLFSIFQAADGESVNIPSETVLPGYNLEWNYNLVFDNADIVSVDVNPANTVSRSAMEAYVSGEIAKITAESIGLGNVDNTADTNKYVAYAQRAGSADKTQSALTIRLNGGRTEGTDMWTFDGSTARTVNVTPAKIGLDKVNNTSDSEKNVAYAASAGQSDKVNNALTIKLNGGITEGSDQFTFDGSMARTINLTPAALGVSDDYPAYESEDYPGCYEIVGPIGLVEYINPPLSTTSGPVLTTERRNNKPVFASYRDFHEEPLDALEYCGVSSKDEGTMRLCGLEGWVLYNDGTAIMHNISEAVEVRLDDPEDPSPGITVVNTSEKKFVGGYLLLKYTRTDI